MLRKAEYYNLTRLQLLVVVIPSSWLLPQRYPLLTGNKSRSNKSDNMPTALLSVFIYLRISGLSSFFSHIAPPPLKRLYFCAYTLKAYDFYLFSASCCFIPSLPFYFSCHWFILCRFALPLYPPKSLLGFKKL